MDRKILFLILLGILVLPLGALAQLHNYGPDISYTSLLDKIETATWIIFAAIAVICFIIAGIMFLTAQGAPDKLQAARSAFIWGVVGVVVGIVAYSIIEIVGSALTAGSK